MNNNTIQLLRRARDIIRDRGWIKGDLEDSKGRVCALGAINAALRDEGLDYWDNARVRTALVEALGKVIRPKGYAYTDSTVYNFNDAPETTKEDVLEKFNEAIRNAKQAATV